MTVRIATLGLLAVIAVAGASGGQERPSVWDVTIGTPVDRLPAGFTDFACGTAGGPPGRLLARFGDHRTCPIDDRGFTEVYFRHDDELEFVARALEQPRAIEVNSGTRVYGVPVIVSALFDADGIVRGLRLETDPRGVPPMSRNDHWTLADDLMHRFGAEGWTCEALGLGDGESAVSSYSVRDRCTKTDSDASMVVLREYLHRRGESFIDVYGRVQSGHFVSRTTFERIGAER
jgi:hypothetical protein